MRYKDPETLKKILKYVNKYTHFLKTVVFFEKAW